jgi:hypothetical protein
VGAVTFEEVSDGIFCSEETGTLAEEDTVNVTLGVVSFNRDITGEDVTDPKSPKFIFAEVILGTAGDTSLGIVNGMLSGKYGVLSLEACAEVSVTTGSICEVHAILVCTLFVISLVPFDATTVATGGHMLKKDVVTMAVEATVSLAEGGFFMKSSVGRQ